MYFKWKFSALKRKVKPEYIFITVKYA